MVRIHKYVNKLIQNRSFSNKILFVASGIFFIFILYLYYQHAVSFSFIDEFNNYMAGYFLLQGKALYTQIFFQHSMLMVYISALLQIIFHPDTLYKLVLYHRIFVVIFALIFEAILIIRLRFTGLLFAIVFELCKYYLFANLFLAESLIVYPILYLFSLNLLLFEKRRVTGFEIIISGLLVWFVVWMREPYIPLILFIYIVLLLQAKNVKDKVLSIAVFLVLSLPIILTTDWNSYIFEVIKVNYVSVAKGELQASGVLGFGILQIFFYPFLILVKGHWNVFRYFSIGLSIFFLSGFLLYSFFKRNWKLVLFIFIALGLSAIRIEVPGTTFYQAYHMIIWYGLCIMSSICFVFALKKEKMLRKLRIILLSCLVLFFVYCFFIQRSYLFDKVNRETDFTINYGRYYSAGQVIATLSQANSTIFVDSWDSLIYWQAKLPVSYRYLFFYPAMDGFDTYISARNDMFTRIPPTFYYAYCGEIGYYSPGIPESVKPSYIQLYHKSGVGTCLYINKSIIPSVTPLQWEAANELGYYLKDE